MATETLTPLQQKMVETWDHHLASEFGTRSAEETLKTMVDHDGYVYVVGSSVGGVENAGEVLEGMDRIDTLKSFYCTKFIPQMPPDIELIPLSRTVGHTQIVDEMVLKFTHSIQMDWMLPGVAPTNKRIETSVVAIVKFEGEKVKAEHVYWDQASLLVQAGLLEKGNLPIAGVEATQQLLKLHNDSSRPAKAVTAPAFCKQGTITFCSVFFSPRTSFTIVEHLLQTFPLFHVGRTQI